MTEKLNLPTEVVNSAWSDDIDFEPYQKEMEYVSPSKIPEESIERIKSMDLRPLFGSRGRKIAKIVSSEQMAA